MPLKSDTEMRAQFESHRAAFEGLVEQTAADTLLQGAARAGPVGRDVLVRDASGYNRYLTPQEVRASGRDAIIRLLEEAGLDGVGRDEAGDLWIEVDRRGRWRKGFRYLHRRPEERVATLDGDHPEYFQGHVELASGWYIELYFKPE